METYLHEKQWEKALVTLDIQMKQPSPATQLQLLKVRFLIYLTVHSIVKISVAMAAAETAS